MNTGGRALIGFLALTYCSTQLYAQAVSKNQIAASDRRKPAIYNSVSYSLNSADSLNSKFYFLKGIGNKISGNMEAAIENFNECLRYDPNNDAAYYELALARFNNQQIPEALTFINKAIQINSSQIWYYNLLATIYDQKGDQASLALVYKKMGQLDPDNSNYIVGQANALANLKRTDEAIALFDKVEKMTGSREEMEFQKQKLYLKTNQVDKALQSMEALIKENPSEPKYYLLEAEIYRDSNQPEKVLGTLRKAISIDSTNGFALLALSDYYRAAGNKELTFSALKKAFSSDDIDVDQKKHLLLDNYVNVPGNDQREGMELAHTVANAYPEDTQAQAIYAGFLAHNPESTPEGRDAVIKVLEQNKENFSLWANLIISDFNLKDYIDAARHAEEALGYFPNQVTLYWYRGIALNQINKSKDAIEVLKSGLSLAAGQPDLEAQLYQVLGDAYHSAGEFRSSDEAYDESLKRRPDDPNTLNNYAYYLTVRKKDLDRAAQMAAKSNVLEPDNASYEDTYAWILYQQKKMNLALIWIEKAMSHGSGNNAIFNDHYGDILFKSGQVDKAIENWKKAKAFGSKDLNLDRKIANKKTYE